MLTESATLPGNTDIMKIASESHAVGMALLQVGKTREAAMQFRQALDIAPDFSDASISLGYCLHQLGKYDEAIAVYETALDNTPTLMAAWNNRGNSLLKLCRYEQAAESYCRALQLAPGLLDARVALATCCQALGLINEAMSACEDVLNADSEHAEAHWNKALLLLLNGDYRQGWREYEWRWQKRDFTSPLRNFVQPLWHGDAIAGRTILIHAEQGFGDTLQFCRYVPQVAGLGAQVIFECHPPLTPVMEWLEGDVTVIPAGQALPPFDLHVPLLSLPLIFDTAVETIPNGVPYLSTPPGRLSSWCTLAAGESRLRVGLCWAGKSYPDPGRSCPADQLVPLADVAGVDFHSLQVGWNGPLPLPMTDHMPHVHDFGDTAALISRLDLVITIDTAVAHLAGAMGKPTWVMLPFAPDWRWMRGRNDSPWYPSMRLFRQHSRGSWRDVVQQVGSSLQNEVSGSPLCRDVK